jgi:FMNH2-dependent dimethyl sulfone monooxygenase
MSSSNPILSSQSRIKLGTFSTNLTCGGTMSLAEGMLKVDWPSTLDLARIADEMKFEAIVPVARWKGFGGQSNFNGESFEVFTWAAGLTARTSHSSVFATCHIPTVHPLFAAKQATTIGHIGGGRFTLNIVTGWYTPEMEMFGINLLDHDGRYTMAEEWVQVVTRLWHESEPFDFAGQFYQLKRAELHPKPIQRPRPLLMSAAGSERGKRFAAAYCDICFVLTDSHTLEDMEARVNQYRYFARSEFSRDVQVWTNAYIYQGDTERDARATWNEVVVEKPDLIALGNYLELIGLQSQQLPLHVYDKVKKHFLAGWGGYPIVGDKNQVVDRLSILKKAGFDGVVLTWPRWHEGLLRFRDEVMPLLEEEGLR